MPHLTQELAQFIYQLRPNDIPTSGTAAVRRGISDYMGVMFAGRNEPVVHHALSMVTLSNGSGIAHVLGDRGKASAADAAFVNAVAGHALDYDDTGLDGHPLPVHSTQSVQSLDALIPARASVPSRVTRRPELDALRKVQRIGNYTVYCTSKFYGLQPA